MSKICSFVIFSLIFLPLSIIAKEPVNLLIHIKELTQYHDSGQYHKDIEEVVKEASNYLKQEVSRPSNGKKRAIVLDIDETALSNYSSMVKLRLGFNPKLWNETENQAIAEAILPTLKLYQLAKAHNIAIIFITGRHEGKIKRAATIKNLKKVGYHQWDKLILKPLSYNGKPAGLYKSAARKQLTEEGFDIILNMGDQQSDLIGNHAKKSFKLPNPYYIVP